MNVYRLGLGMVWLVGSSSPALAQGPAHLAFAGAEATLAPAALPILPVDACNAAAFRNDSLPVSSIDDTTGATDDVNLDETGSCAGGGTQFFGTGTGPDHIYGVRVDKDCDLQIQLQATGNIDLALYLLTSCGDVSGSCLDVNDTAGLGGLEELGLSATAGTDYFVIVDGNQGGAGPYELTISETTATGCRLVGDPECGNGTVETGEECDDSNQADGDGCSAMCQREDVPDAGVDVPDAGMDTPDAGDGSDAGGTDEDAGPIGGDAGPGDGDAGPGGPGDGNGGGCCQSSPPTDSVPPIVLVALGWLWSRRRSMRLTGRG